MTRHVLTAVLGACLLFAPPLAATAQSTSSRDHPRDQVEALFRTLPSASATVDQRVKMLFRTLPPEHRDRDAAAGLADSLSGIRERRSSSLALASPHAALVPEMLAAGDISRVLSSPDVRQALSRMNRDEIAHVLTGLRDAAILHPDTSGIPPLSMVGRGSVPGEDASPVRNLLLDDWRLVRRIDGMPALQRQGDVASLLPVEHGMVLGAFGRVIAIDDRPGVFHLVLETGDVIHGDPLDMPVLATRGSFDPVSLPETARTPPPRRNSGGTRP